MIRPGRALVRGWLSLGPRFLPFADAASDVLPLSRLLRLSLFQVSVGMALVLLSGTLNRVMIVELRVSAWLVSLMVALPIVFAPLRAFIGFRSDHHRSALGWRRVPYIWMGTLVQFGGFAIMPFSLLILSGDTHGPAWIGPASAALAFLLVGAGLHTVQTAGLALAADLAPEEARPRVVALLYVMLLVGMVAGSLVFGWLLAEFSQMRLIQVIQGAALVTMVLNGIALWKQEARDPARTSSRGEKPRFADSFRDFVRTGKTRRFLIAVCLGTAGFSMQDVLLEPYGGEVLKLGVGATTMLTALSAGGALAAFALASRMLGRRTDPYRLSASGALVGVAAFAAVVLSAPLDSPALFRSGAFLIGFGGGLFAVGMLTAAMNLESGRATGLALGAWGAAQATAAGASIALGGALRDGFNELATGGLLGPALGDASVGYGAVYLFEIMLLFATLVAIGPLVRAARAAPASTSSRIGLATLPG